MTQAKRKRRRKHRGTQAGTIERPGRTGQSHSQTAPESAKPSRQRSTRFNRPPTWKGSLNRAALASLVFGVLVVLVFKQNPLQGVFLAVVMFGIYWPMTFYTDRFIYKRKNRSQSAATQSTRQPPRQ